MGGPIVVEIGLGFLVGVVAARIGDGLLGCDFLLNLRDFKSEALVLGNCTFEGGAEEGPAVGLDAGVVVAVLEGVSSEGLCFWLTAGVSEVPVMRRFFWVWRLFAFSDVEDINDEEADREDGGP